MRCITILLILSVAACSGSTSPTIDAAIAVDAESRAYLDYKDVFARYGVIETIAGRGRIEAKGVDGWRTSFEGGRATAAELSRPHMAQGDTLGNVYIADKDGHAIRRIDPAGMITTFAGTSIEGDGGDGPGAATSMRLSSPNGLWLSESGELYVLDLGNDKVRRIESGSMRTLFSVGGLGPGRGLWVANDESLAYIAAGTVLKKWTPDAGVQVLASGFSSLGNLFVEPSGDILLADRGASRVFRISPSGAKTAVAGNGGKRGGGDGQAALATGLEEVRGVWGNPGGGFWLVTHKGHQVWYVDDQGMIHLFLSGGSGEHAGDGLPFDDPRVRISEPRAITLDARGNILITENDGGYIRRVNIAP